MANRTTAAEVDQIMDLESSVTDTTIERYITMANALVDELLGTDTSLSSTLKQEIECNLAAHFIASTIARMGAVERLGEARVDYTGKWGEGLKSTPYGQNVLLLDTTGKMAEGSQGRAYIKAIGSWDDD
jgi:hypothetical protein